MKYTIFHLSQDGTGERSNEGTYTWDEIVEGNGDDCEFMGRLAAMKPGETITDGGGAAWLVEIECSEESK